jgi:hypothetical protein
MTWDRDPKDFRAVLQQRPERPRLAPLPPPPVAPPPPSPADWAQVELPPPQRKSRWPSVWLWAVLVREVGDPAGIEPLEWMLLTTEPVADFAAAVEKRRWYALRWGMEVFQYEGKALVAFVTASPIRPTSRRPCARRCGWWRLWAASWDAKGMPEPGTQTLWRGLQRPDDIAEADRVFRSAPKEGPVSSNGRYG